MLEGEGDEYPEAGFYMMGTLEEAFEEGRRLMREAGSKWFIFVSILINNQIHKFQLNYF